MELRGGGSGGHGSNHSQKVSVITLTLTWHQQASLPSEQPGWDFEISGKSKYIDMTYYKFFWIGGPPYRRQSSGKIVGDGPPVWALTADEEPLLGMMNGARREKPPMAFVARYLEALEKKNHSVVASHSTVIGEDSDQVVSHIWTLNYMNNEHS